ncbi:DNA-binding response regulator [Minwuia thermotolerans]|uniref:DNA-binding response regulator n=2 Tax=Minwuia thermotolerans TaxID=2056226 RepID=A0A2M9G1Y8_9PROT|nr:DNA-binding response regulator [Minwuia thermotolerans]
MSAMMPHPAGAGAGQRTHRMRLIVADDHEMVRLGLTLRLSQAYPDAEIVEADCYRCLEGVYSEGGPPDLVITDLKMPDGEWRRELQMLRARCPQTRVLVFSALESAQIVRSILPDLADGFIPKSADGHTLMAAIRLVLDGGVYVPLTALESMHEEGGTGGPAPAASPALPLTPRQVDVLRMIALGKANKQIAYELGLSVGTVKIHVSNILDALGATNRTEAIAIARDRYGLGSEPGT